MSNSNFPTAQGKYQLTAKWLIILPDEFNVRDEDGSRVFWKKGTTIYITIYRNNNNLSPKQQIEFIKKNISEKAYSVQEEEEGVIYRLTYKLRENNAPLSIYGFIAGKSGYVQIGIYLDNMADEIEAAKIIRSVDESYMKKYGEPFLLEKNKPVELPDFLIEYLGDREVEMPKYVHKYFLYRDYKLTFGSSEKVISWTNGAGVLAPLKFEVSGKKYFFQPWGLDFQHKEIAIYEGEPFL